LYTGGWTVALNVNFSCPTRVNQLLAFLAFINLPTGFSPLTNWLSDLSSYQLNPKGANF
jgi:hypothetical protein